MFLIYVQLFELILKHIIIIFVQIFKFLIVRIR